VWQSALDAELKPVAAVMADMGNQDGLGIYPSVEYIAWLLSRSERSIQSALKKLVQKGILDRVANAKGGRGLTPRYRLNADALPERPKWRSESKGAESAPFSNSVKGCNEQQERVQSTTQKGAELAPDPLVDPLVNRKSGNTSSRSHKPPEPETVIDPPFHGKEFMLALTQYETVKKEIKSPLTPTSREALYCKLAKFDEETATIALSEAAASGYKGVFPDKVKGNGNGYSKGNQEYTGPVKSKPDPRIENCPDCRGMLNIQFEIDGVKYAKPCKHERSGVVAA
jgi:hypothetical protein